MKPLQEFASNDNQPLFVQAKTLPQFFHHNLIDPARVVKVFNNDPQANIRIFYYQYLKLCFELDNVNYQSYINKIQQIINNQDFKFIFYEDDDPSLFSDLQFKNLIMQFFGVLGDGNITIEAALNRFPVMDTVFIYFFRAFLILTGKAESLDSYVERDELLQYLCSHFQVEISLHDKCIKFVQTDIFAYEEDPKEVFMAFMDYDRVQNQSQLEPPQQTVPHYLAQNHQDLNQNQEQINKFTSHFGSPVDLSRPELHSHQYLGENNGFQQNLYNVPPVKLETQTQPVQNSSNYPASNGSSRRGNNELNQSYIASEFVDYTSAINHNFVGLDAKTTFKDSGSVDSFKNNQPSTIKADQFAYNFEQITKKPASKPSGYQFQPQSQTTYSAYDTKSNSGTFNYNYELDKLSTYNGGNFTNNLSSYMSKTNYNVEIPTFKKTELQENIYIPQNDWQPTKDPGFTQKYSTDHYVSSNSYPKPVSPSSSYQPISNTSYEQTDYTKTLNQKKPSSQSLHTSDSLQQLQAKKPISSESAQPQFINNYIPTYSNSTSYQNQYIGQVALPKPSSGKNPFGLNVSLEFTNSFTMKAMNEPYRTNVASIRQKARNFRNSLVSYIK